LSPDRCRRNIDFQHHCAQHDQVAVDEPPPRERDPVVHDGRVGLLKALQHVLIPELQYLGMVARYLGIKDQDIAFWGTTDQCSILKHFVERT
jgi:hypothetical protein